MITVHGIEGCLHGQNDPFLLLTQDKMLIFKFIFIFLVACNQNKVAAAVVGYAFYYRFWCWDLQDLNQEAVSGLA